MAKTTAKKSTKSKKPALKKKTVKDISAGKSVKGGAAPGLKSVRWCRD